MWETGTFAFQQELPDRSTIAWRSTRLVIEPTGDQLAAAKSRTLCGRRCSVSRRLRGSPAVTKMCPSLIAPRPNPRREADHKPRARCFGQPPDAPPADGCPADWRWRRGVPPEYICAMRHRFADASARRKRVRARDRTAGSFCSPCAAPRSDPMWRLRMGTEEGNQRRQQRGARAAVEGAASTLRGKPNSCSGGNCRFNSLVVMN